MATAKKKKTVAKKAKQTTSTRTKNARSAPAKKQAKKSVKKKTTRTSSTAKKTTRKTSTNKTVAKKATTRKTAAKKTTRKTIVKKSTSAKKSTAKKSAPKKKAALKKKTAPIKPEPVPVAAGVTEPMAVAADSPEYSSTEEYREDFNALKGVLTPGEETLVREEVVPSPESEIEVSNAEQDEAVLAEDQAEDLEGAAEERVQVEPELAQQNAEISEGESAVQSELAAKRDLDGTDEVQLVCFSIAEEEYGVDIYRVQEINRVVSVTALPEMPPYIQGIINLRGNVIPVIDLRYRLGFPSHDEDKDTRIMVLDYNNALVGLTVDSVTKVLRVSRSTMEPIPRQASTQGADFLEGIIRLDDRLIMVIDCRKVVEL